MCRVRGLGFGASGFRLQDLGFRLQELNQDANSRVSVFLKLWNYEPKNQTPKPKGFKDGTKQLR